VYISTVQLRSTTVVRLIENNGASPLTLFKGLVVEALVGDMPSIDGLFSLEMLARDGC